MSGDSEVQQLRCKLKEAEESLQKAAQYGLELLDGQLDLQNQLEEQRVEMTNTLEVSHCHLLSEYVWPMRYIKSCC